MATSTSARTYNTGAQYSGGLNSDGVKSGLGRLTYPNGAKYVGDFQDGLCSGYGNYKSPDGSTYSGEFLKGKFHGYGAYSRPDGMMFQGQFYDGKPEGYGLVTYPDGTHGVPRNEGYFENFKMKRAEKAHSHVYKGQQAAEKASLLIPV